MQNRIPSKKFDCTEFSMFMKTYPVVPVFDQFLCGFQCFCVSVSPPPPLRQYSVLLYFI